MFVGGKIAESAGEVPVIATTVGLWILSSWFARRIQNPLVPHALPETRVLDQIGIVARGFVDGIGPAISRIVTWPAGGGAPRFTELVPLARAAGLAVHPYTIRVDDLPRNCPSAGDLHTALFTTAGVDGAFSDFTDQPAAWLRRQGRRP